MALAPSTCSGCRAMDSEGLSDGWLRVWLVVVALVLVLVGLVLLGLGVWLGRAMAGA